MIFSCFNCQSWSSTLLFSSCHRFSPLFLKVVT
nr:MAG TPA: hypothetical protein [Caudoviricetes sp.]